MKLILVVLFVVAVAVQADQTKDEDSSWKECLAENNIKIEEFSELNRKKDPKVRCFTACRFEKEGVLKNGQISKDEMTKQLLELTSKITTEQFSTLYDTCLASVKATDICDVSNELSTCLQRTLARTRP